MNNTNNKDLITHGSETLYESLIFMLISKWEDYAIHNSIYNNSKPPTLHKECPKSFALYNLYCSAHDRTDLVDDGFLNYWNNFLKNFTEFTDGYAITKNCLLKYGNIFSSNEKKGNFLQDFLYAQEFIGTENWDFLQKELNYNTRIRITLEGFKNAIKSLYSAISDLYENNNEHFHDIEFFQFPVRFEFKSLEQLNENQLIYNSNNLYESLMFMLISKWGDYPIHNSISNNSKPPTLYKECPKSFALYNLYCLAQERVDLVDDSFLNYWNNFLNNFTGFADGNIRLKNHLKKGDFWQNFLDAKMNIGTENWDILQEELEHHAPIIANLDKFKMFIIDQYDAILDFYTSHSRHSHDLEFFKFEIHLQLKSIKHLKELPEKINMFTATPLYEDELLIEEDNSNRSKETFYEEDNDIFSAADLCPGPDHHGIDKEATQQSNIQLLGVNVLDVNDVD